VLLGSDAPFPLGELQPGALVESVYGDDAGIRERILAGNARRVFARAELDAGREMSGT